MQQDVNLREDWAIRRQRNSRQVVALLPTEILLRICAHLVPSLHTIDRLGGCEEKKPDWSLIRRQNSDDLITFTHVCHHWRAVALGWRSPWRYLWVTDHRHSAAQNEAFAERSCGLPLEVAVHDQNFASTYKAREKAGGYKNRYLRPTVDLMALLHKLFPHGPSRIKRLRIGCYMPIGTGIDSIFFKQPAPQLESLAIADSIGMHVRSYKLPNDLFARSAPVLRELSIEQINLSWDFPLFKNLTLLRIIDGDAWTSDAFNPMVPMARLLQILADCPNLVTLELENVGPREINGNEDGNEDRNEDEGLLSSRKIDLPFLQVLILTGLATHRSCRELLGHLSTPTLRHLHISHEGRQLMDKADLLPPSFHLHPRITQANEVKIIINARIKLIEIELFVVENLEEALRLELEGLSFDDIPDEPNFKCKFRYENLRESSGINEESFFRLAMTFISHMCTQHIRSLSICNIEPLSFDSPFEIPYAELFNHLSDIQCLEVSNEIASSLGFVSERRLPRFLKESAVAADSNGTVALPAVKTLEFCLLEFTARSFNDVCAFLSHRRRQGMPISLFKVIYCEGLEPKMIQVLQDLVKRIDIDLLDDALSSLPPGAHGEDSGATAVLKDKS